MGWDIDWSGVGAFATGGGFVAFAGGCLFLWKTWRANQQEAAKGDIDVTDKERESRAREDLRIIDYWKALNAESKAQLMEIIDRLEAKQVETDAELDKRRKEHEECQRSDAVKSAQIAHLQETSAEKTEQIRELRTRVETLERHLGYSRVDP